MNSKLLCALVTFAAPQLAYAQSLPVITTAGMRLELSETDGHVRALRDGSGRLLGGSSTDSVGLWSLELKPGWGVPFIRASEAGRFTWHRVSRDRIDSFGITLIEPQRRSFA